MSRTIILASTSPRRRELLERACVKFTVESPQVEEDMSQKVSPQQLVKNLAFAKASAVAARHKDAIVIGADTVVALGNKRWSKPESEKEARMMLRTLSGKQHEIWTGFCILDTKIKKRVLKAVRATLQMRKLTSAEIEGYIKTGEPMDGAGGYKIQGAGGFLADFISGDYSSVLGLPLSDVLAALQKFGIRR